MSIQLQAAEALLESRFAPIKQLAAHKHSEFAAKTKCELTAKALTYNWLCKIVEDYGKAEKYYINLQEEARKSGV